jgi:hypothetical protein
MQTAADLDRERNFLACNFGYRLMEWRRLAMKQSDFLGFGTASPTIFRVWLFLRRQICRPFFAAVFHVLLPKSLCVTLLVFP